MRRRYFLKASLAATALMGTRCGFLEQGSPGGDTPDGGPVPDGGTDTPPPLRPHKVGLEHYDWDADGNKYELQQREHRVRRLDAAGAEVWSLEEHGDGDGLNHPAELVHSPLHGVIYVMDHGNSRVLKVDAATGQVKGIIGGHGDEAGENGHTMDAAVDDAGRLVMVDPWNHRVQFFSHDGNAELAFGELGTDQQHHLNWPRAVAIDHREHLHVVDRGNARVQVFDATGKWLRQYGDEHLSAPRAIAIDSVGRAYVADSHAGTVFVYDDAGAKVDERRIEFEGAPAHPIALNWAPGEELYVRVSEHRQQKEG